MCDLLDPNKRVQRTAAAAPSTGVPLFPLGRTVATPAALALLEKHGVSASALLARHQCGNWGDVGVDSAMDNVNAIEIGARILSVYRLLPPETLARMTSDERRRSATVWVITESDRWSTAILTPECF